MKTDLSRRALVSTFVAAAVPVHAESAAPVSVAAQPQVISDPYVLFARSPHDWSAPPWVGAPSIAENDSRNLLVSYTYFGKGSEMDTAFILASSDGGKTWQPTARISPMFWPSLFRCASGLYILGVDRPYDSGPNHLVIARSPDGGKTWSKPAALTSKLWVHTGNIGVLVSRGRVTRSLELVPENGKRRFQSMVMDAEETADLCNPAAWRISNPVVNPAYRHLGALKELFGIDFDLKGSTWLEGVLLRMEHPGGSGKIVNLLRVNNEITPNLSARIEVDDSGPGLRCRFERFTSDPGLGIAHCFARYDSATALYWMTSNVARDSTRDLTGSNMHFAGNQERSNLALYYSRNALDWYMAGLVAYSPDWVHSFHYPYFIFHGNDLLVVARSHVESPLTEKTVRKGTANRHDSNAATFHRVRNFRSMANLEFIRYRIG